MLNGALVTLRPVHEEDLDWIVTEFSKPSTSGEFEPFFLGNAESLRWRFQEDRLLSQEKTRLIVEEKGGRRIGVASIDDLDLHARVARIGATILDPHLRGRGLGTEAHRLLVSYLFVHFDLARVEAFVAAGNLAARSVFRKLGFTEEGTLRRRFWAHGHRHDVVVYGLLQDEWARRSDPGTITI